MYGITGAAGSRAARVGVVALMTLGLLSTACTEARVADRVHGPDFSDTTTRADFRATGTLGQIYIRDGRPGSLLTAYDIADRAVASGTVDELGSLVLRELKPGAGYRVQRTDVDGPRPTSRPVRVTSVESSLPRQSFYDRQQLRPGFGYITARDGTTLSTAVYLPGPVEDGPYPTVVEYSGYSPSNPTKSLKDDLASMIPGVDPASLCGIAAVVCTTPDQPASEIALAMGYAVVAVNMRGTGCSGGAYDFFEPLQLTDGYDIIETAAAQPWVKGGKVGMVGLSYPGIAQLFVASTRPPHLAAITPMSVYDDTGRGVLAPGGIFNKGFALTWAREVLDNAKPEGQKWTKTVIDDGDETCAANQRMRLQNVDSVAKARANPTYDPKVADPLNPSLFVNKIDVPVFMTGAWQDEQTGGRFSNLFNRFTSAPVRKFIAFNGAHADGFSPETMVEWKAFLDFYVAGKLTPIPGFFRQFGGILLDQVFGVTVPFPEERWLNEGSFEEAKAKYEAEPEVQVRFERGADEPLGAPASRFEHDFASWPPKATATALYFQADGSMGSAKPTGPASASRFVTDPALADAVTLPGDSVGDAFLALPDYQWDNDKDGDAAVFLTAPLAEDQVVVGNSNADLWVRSSSVDGDVGVTLTEVRPDGKEMYVQSGFLRLQMRKLAPGSTELRPQHTGFAKDLRPMPAGRFQRAQVEMLPFAHVFRKGSRIRVSVHTPGGDKPRWSWILQPFDTPPVIDIAHDATHPSRLVLPVVSGITGYPEALAPCPSLRGQPCRDFQPYSNEATPAP